MTSAAPNYFDKNEMPLKHGVTSTARSTAAARMRVWMDLRRTWPLRRCLLTSVATIVLVVAVLAVSAVLWAGVSHVRGPTAQSHAGRGRGDGGLRKLDLFYALNLDYSQRTVIHYHHIVSVGPDCVGGAFAGSARRDMFRTQRTTLHTHTCSRLCPIRAAYYLKALGRRKHRCVRCAAAYWQRFG